MSKALHLSETTPYTNSARSFQGVKQVALDNCSYHMYATA